MSKPGRLTADELAPVQSGMQLANGAAAAYKRLKAAAKKRLGRSISIPGPAGAYRSAAVQHAMHEAGGIHGTRAARLAWGLNPRSTVAIADDPNGTHQDGSSVDIIGTPIDASFLKLAEEHGFTRTFGPRDPNHFGYHAAADKHRSKAKK